MLKKVRIKNFESHEDSEIEFTNGFNLIVGQSNQGKSSLVRAIALIVANRFDKDSVRTGADYCEVEIESDKGSVMAQRGESINRWVIQYANGEKKEYKNVGTSVPPDVIKILGMGERTHGDIKELSNIMFQFEKHYMISEIDGKKATSNMIARMMDEAIGIGGMEELIKDMATDFQNFKKDLNSCTSDISDIKSEIMDEDIFNDKRKSVEELRSKYEQVEETEKLLKDSENISSKLLNINSRLSELPPRISRLNDVELLWSNVNSILEKLRAIQNAVELRNKISNLNFSISSSNEIISSYEQIELLHSKLEMLKKANEKMKKIENISSRCFDYEYLKSSLEDLESKKKNIENAEKMLYDARLVYRRMMKADNGAKTSSSKLEEVDTQLHDLMDELGTCPLCGALLNEESKQH